jgi:ankyrin repeat protein
VEFLVSQRADVRSKTADGCTPLHAASGACVPPTCRPLPPPDPAIVKFLLDKGADPKAADARGRTALHGLVARGEGALVRSLLDRGAEVNAKDQRGRTPLHRAVECGNESAVDALLAAHADVNATDATGRTPIRLAPYSLSYTTYNPPMVKKLLDHGAQVDLVTTIALGSVEQVAAAIERDPKAVNQKGKTQDERLPLHWAVSRKSPEMVKLLLDHGADPNAKEKDGNPPLHGAVFAQNPQVVSMLIAAKADVNALGQGDCTALYWACNNLDVEVVNLLLAAGADPNTKAARQPNPLSAVLQSAREGRFGFAQKSTPAERSALAKTLINALLDHKADPNGPVWGGGYSPIFGADEEQAELLLSRGARLDVTTEDGNTLLHYAAILSRGDLARFAIKHKLSLEAKNKKGETPLHCAVGYLRPSEAVVEMILAANPDLGAKDNEGRSPLHRAVIIGSVPAATALLDHQADPEARDNEGATPLHHAAKLGRDNMVALLIDRGAAVNVRDKAGRTPLDWATRETTRALLVEHGATGK